VAEVGSRTAPNQSSVATAARRTASAKIAKKDMEIAENHISLISATNVALDDLVSRVGVDDVSTQRLN